MPTMTPVQPLPSIHRYGGTLPVAPMRPVILADAEYLHRTHDENAEGRRGSIRGLDRLATRTGINVRQLLTYITKSDGISLDQADKYLCATGRHLRDVYPWLYTPEQIAADIAAVEAREPGVHIRHRKGCAKDPCSCSPSYNVDVWRDGRRTRRTFERREDARAWRQEWMVRA